MIPRLDINSEDMLPLLDKYAEQTTVTFIDIESGGLYINNKLIQLYNPKVFALPIVIDLDSVNEEVVLPYLRKMYLMAWGASYEAGALGIPIQEDLQLAVRSLYPNIKKYKLDIACKALLSKDWYLELNKSVLQKKGFAGVLTEEQYDYAVTDVLVMQELMNIPKINNFFNTKRPLYYTIDMISLNYSHQFQKNGAIIHKESVLKELELLPNKLEEEESILSGVNSKSVPQVKAKFAELGEIVPSTGKAILIDIITRNGSNEIGQFATAVLNNRRTRLRNTNLNKLNKDKVYTKFNPYGTVTGRFSSSGGDMPNGINFQNVTRDLQYILATDTEDTIVIHADYSTAELRSACSIMADSKMREFLLQRIDLHKVSATLADTTLTIDTVSKEDRQKGKAVSFGFIFGMSARAFKEYAYTEYGVLFTDEEALLAKKSYQSTYPDITKYHRYWWNNYATEPTISPMGRRNMARLGTDAINFSTQASIGECCKLAIHYLIKDNPNEPMLDYLYSQVHDAIYLRVPKSKAYLGEKLAQAMLKGWEQLLKLSMFKFKDIPMEVEVEISNKTYVYDNYKK